MNTNHQKPIEWRGVQFSEEFISEVSGGRVGTSTQRQLVKSIVLRHGFQTQHFMWRVCAGVALAGLGVGLPMYYFFRAARLGSLVVLAPAFFLVIATFGISVAYKALRRGYYLEADVGATRLRFSFRNQPKIGDVEIFLKSVEEKFGYNIERSGATSGFAVIDPRSRNVG